MKKWEKLTIWHFKNFYTFFNQICGTCHVCYREEMVLMFYVDDYLVFSNSKDKIDDVYASLQEYYNPEDYGDLNKYLRIELTANQVIQFI